MKNLTISLFLLAFTTLGFSQSHELALNLKNGETYEQLVSSQMQILQEISGQKIDIDMNIDGLMAYKVVGEDKDSYTLEVIYKSMGMKMVMQQMTMYFNSSDEGKEDQFSKMLKAITNKPFEVVMAKNGKVKQVNNLEAIFNSSISQFDEMPAAQLEQMKSQLSQSYGTDAFKGNIEMVTAIFPDKKVKVGESWKVNTQLKSGFEAGINTTYTLVEKNKDFYTISGEATIATKDTEEMTQMNGMPMRFDMDGKMLSKIKVDSETGWIIEATIDQNIAGDAHIGDTMGSGVDMVSKMQMNGGFKITNGK